MGGEGSRAWLWKRGAKTVNLERTVTDSQTHAKLEENGGKGCWRLTEMPQKDGAQPGNLRLEFPCRGKWLLSSQGHQENVSVSIPNIAEYLVFIA